MVLVEVGGGGGVLAAVAPDPQQPVRLAAAQRPALQHSLVHLQHNIILIQQIILYNTVSCTVNKIEKFLNSTNIIFIP